MRSVLIIIVAAAVTTGGCSQPSEQFVKDATRDYVLDNTVQLAQASAVVTDVPYGVLARLAVGQVDSPEASQPRSPDEPLKQAGQSAGYTPWRSRVGPAYPGDFWHSFGRWAKELPDTLWDDTKATFTDTYALVGIGLAGAAGIAVNASGADDSVQDHYTKNGSQLNKFGDMVGDIGGNPGLHFAVAGAALLTAMANDDNQTYENANTMINALAVTGLTTIALKGIVDTRVPNGHRFGWPSGHTSSSFCFATVIYDQYGPLYGLPLMAFATFVAYERVDARNHDFSDVVSGAIIGYVIGHAVAKNHQVRVAGMDLIPYVNPRTGGFGLALSKRW